MSHIKSLLTVDINNIVLLYQPLIETQIASCVDRLDIRYFQTVIAHSRVVNAETMTQILENLAVSKDVI